MNSTSCFEPVDRDRPRMKLDINATKRFLAHAGVFSRPSQIAPSSDKGDDPHLPPEQVSVDLEEALRMMRDFYQSHVRIEHIRKELARSEPGKLLDGENESESQSEKTPIEYTQKLQDDCQETKHLMTEVAKQFASIALTETSPSLQTNPSTSTKSPGSILSNARELLTRMNEFNISLERVKQLSASSNPLDINTLYAYPDATFFQSSTTLGLESNDHDPDMETWPTQPSVTVVEDLQLGLEALDDQLQSVESRLIAVSEKQKTLEILSALNQSVTLVPESFSLTEALDSSHVRTMAQEMTKDLTERLNSDVLCLKNCAKDSSGFSRSCLLSLLDSEDEQQLIETLVTQKLHAIPVFSRLQGYLRR
ncbi:hypothetical protein FB446DRAFT_844410 [Lentinula raphanica]|nr:hypothetical protein FB446DRAFT_844410 [Lentinula raphanica]